MTIDDHSHFVARFQNGALGTITASWVTPGRKMQLEFELVGTRGSIAFSQERFNELELYAPGGRKGRDGFKTLVSGPDTPPYGNFCPAPGHQLGFNDLKTIEVAHLIQAIVGAERGEPGFPGGLRNPARRRRRASRGREGRGRGRRSKSSHPTGLRTTARGGELARLLHFPCRGRRGPGFASLGQVGDVRPRRPPQTRAIPPRPSCLKMRA